MSRAAGVVLAAGYFVFAARLDVPNGLATALFFGVPVAGGALIGRWWAVLLPLLLFASLAIFGDGCAAEAARDPSVECDINWWALLAMFYVPIDIGLVAIGVGAHRFVRWRTAGSGTVLAR